MVIGVLKKGDTVINVTNEFVAIQRNGGETDIIPLIKETNYWRLDTDNIVTIGYGDNTITYEHENGIHITNF